MTWQQFAIAEVFLMVLPATTFPIFYGAFWPWWKSSEGRAIFTLGTGLALLVDFATLYQLKPDMPGRTIVASVVYGVILFALISLNASLIAGWRERKSQ